MPAIHIVGGRLAKCLLFFDNLRLKPEDLRVDIFIFYFHLQSGFFSIPLRFLLFSCVASRKNKKKKKKESCFHRIIITHRRNGIMVFAEVKVAGGHTDR